MSDVRDLVHDAPLEALQLVLSIGLIVLVLAGCSSLPVPGGIVKAAVWVPCPVDVPDRPVFAADTLTGAEDLFTIGSRLWADRKARQAYELQLETRLVGCTAPKRP